MSRTKTIRILACALAAAGMLAGAAPSRAYRMINVTTSGRVTAGAAVPCTNPGGFVHWDITTMRWYLNPAGQGAGKAAAFQAAMQSWTNVTNAGHVLQYAGTTTAGWLTDGKNTALWAVGNGCTGGCLAITALWIDQPSKRILESDISFNSAFAWKTDGTDFDTQAVAAHELGHSLGIHHTELTNAPLPTMFAIYFGPDGRTLENDDRAALQCAEGRYPVTCEPLCDRQYNECYDACIVNPYPTLDYCTYSCLLYNQGCLSDCN